MQIDMTPEAEARAKRMVEAERELFHGRRPEQRNTPEDDVIVAVGTSIAHEGARVTAAAAVRAWRYVCEQGIRGMMLRDFAHGLLMAGPEARDAILSAGWPDDDFDEDAEDEPEAEA